MAKASRLTRSTGQPTEVSEGQVTGTSEMPPTGEEPSGHAESKPPASDPMSTPGTGQEQLPLSGIRVIDVGNFLAGPYAASILGEFGAEVLKIEHPLGGDPMRRFGTATARHDATLAWLSEARNRKSVTIDLRQQEGVALFLKLVAKSDILIENFRPGTMEEWGLSWPVLQATNPGLIMLRVSGYGQTGPYRRRSGFAHIAHAFSGLSYLAGFPGETPVLPGTAPLGDYIASLFGAIGILIALRHKEQTGRGQLSGFTKRSSGFWMRLPRLTVCSARFVNAKGPGVLLLFRMAISARRTASGLRLPVPPTRCLNGWPKQWSARNWLRRNCTAINANGWQHAIL